MRERLGADSGPWTAGVAMPGGDFAVGDVGKLVTELRRDYDFLTGRWALRLIRAYGTDARRWLGTAKSAQDLGQDFGATLTARRARRGPPQAAGTTPGTQSMDTPPLRL